VTEPEEQNTADELANSSDEQPETTADELPQE
jgi:hypothetical protein